MRFLRRLATLLLLASLAVTLKPAQAPVAAPLRITAKPVQLHIDDPRATQLGELTWRGGLELDADTPAFGGLSDLVISDDGRDLIAVDDKGNWVSAELSYGADGHLSDIAGIRLDTYRGPDGRAVAATAFQDAESITRRNGTLLVGFEQRHRIWAYPDGLDGSAQDFPIPAGVAEGGANGGAEALQQLADGRLLLIDEDRPEGADSFAAWLYIDNAWQPLEVTTEPGYHPAGLGQLPGGDVLLLTRKFTPLGGFQIRLHRIALAAVEPGARLQGREIAHFRRPYLTDNFEGVAARRGAGGETLVYLLSDDNFMGLQRTLLLLFALEE